MALVICGVFYVPALRPSSVEATYAIGIMGPDDQGTSWSCAWKAGEYLECTNLAAPSEIYICYQGPGGEWYCYPDTGSGSTGTVQRANQLATWMDGHPQQVPSRPPLQYIQGGNFVGQLWVWGNGTGYDTTGAVAVQAVGGQAFDESSQAHTEQINSTIARANPGGFCSASGGCFKLYAAPRSDNGWALGAGSYDVLIVNDGYLNHTTPYDSPEGASKVGAVTIGTLGKITAATDATGLPLAVNANIAGEFKVPSSFLANITPHEAGVWLHGPECVNDMEAPLFLG